MKIKVKRAYRYDLELDYFAFNIGFGVAATSDMVALHLFAWWIEISKK